jgi:hypothetical protein
LEIDGLQHGKQGGDLSLRLLWQARALSGQEAQGPPLTGIVLVTEMTANVTMLLPILGACFCGYVDTNATI